MSAERTGTRRWFTLLWRISVVMLCLLLVMKWGVVDGFEVRGNSMEPLLRDRHGDPDMIAVFKRHYDLFEPDRFELVVFDRPQREAGSSMPAELRGDRFVKRLVGFPGDEILIRGGDLFVVSPEGTATRERPAERPTALILDMLKEVSRLEPERLDAWRIPEACELHGDELVLDGREQPARLRYAELIRDDWVDQEGTLQLGGTAVNDIALETTLVLSSAGTEVVLELREEGDTFSAILSGAGPARLTRQRGPQDAEEIARTGSEMIHLEAGREARIQFLNVDDRLILLIDGVELLRCAYSAQTEVAGMPSNEPSILIRGGSARLRQVRVSRDVYYTEAGCRFGVRKPYRVPEGEYFLLGDNSVNSRDSRHFGSIPRSRFVGRPFLIFHPFGRWRSL